MRIYPNCPFVTRTLEIGGLTKSQLIRKMQQQSISMNEYAKRLFADEKFTTSDTKYSLQIVKIAVEDLDFSDGATLSQIFKKASELGLELCPLEVGPHLRLEYLEQPEGDSRNPSHQHQAPSGSITIASEIISKDDYFPKGFYLRKINDVLWLRGYIADDLHVWNPNDQFIFMKNKKCYTNDAQLSFSLLE